MQRTRAPGARRSAKTRAPAAVLGLAAACLAAAHAGCGAPDGPRWPPIVLVTLDTTRVDHLGIYGYARDTSPRLDALAEDAVVFTRAYSTSSWTLPAHASLFTGKLTAAHGARYDPDGPLALSDGIAGERYRGHRARGLSASERTLAAVLRDAGYATAAMVGGPWMKRVFGLDAGFDHYDDDGIDALNGRRAAELTDAALAWLDVAREGPPFLFLNYYDPHAPFAPPEGFRAPFFDPDAAAAEPGSLRTLRDLYDSEIRYMDEQLGRLLDGLRERGLYDDAWIVVTGDHGELFGEHGLFMHGQRLTEVEIRVPLVVKAPGGEGAGTSQHGAVSVTDVLPLLLGALDLPAPAGIQGRAPGRTPRPVVAELHPLRRRTLRALIEGTWKLVEREGGARELFDLAADPGEASDVAGRESGRADAMQASLARLLAELAPPPQDDSEVREVDAETRRALENLGYLEPADAPDSRR